LPWIRPIQFRPNKPASLKLGLNLPKADVSGISKQFIFIDVPTNYHQLKVPVRIYIVNTTRKMPVAPFKSKDLAARKMVVGN
jgi:hypothetical protein